MFRLAPEKNRVIRGICQKLELLPIEVTSYEYNQQLGYLAGFSGFKRSVGKYKGKGISDEMLVFGGVSSSRMDDFLAAYKESGLPKVELKAAVTPVNASWTPLLLFEEIKKEHEQMG